MSIEKLITERRSIALFEDKPVQLEELKEMLEVAKWVPNHKMTEPWRFTIISGETKKELAKLAGEFMSRGKAQEEKKRAYDKAFQTFDHVPIFLMVTMEEHHDLKVRQEDYASTSILIHNLSLLAWERGLGLIWKTGPLTETEAFRELIQIRKGEKFIGMIQLGYPKIVPKARPRQDLKSKITELN